MRILRRRGARVESVWLNEKRTAREKGDALSVLGRAVVIVRHPYTRDPASGSGNCWCGRIEDSPLHRIVVEPCSAFGGPAPEPGKGPDHG